MARCVRIGDWTFGRELDFLLIAGSCAIESEEGYKTPNTDPDHREKADARKRASDGRTALFLLPGCAV